MPELCKHFAGKKLSPLSQLSGFFGWDLSQPDRYPFNTCKVLILCKKKQSPGREWEGKAWRNCNWSRYGCKRREKSFSLGFLFSSRRRMHTQNINFHVHQAGGAFPLTFSANSPSLFVPSFGFIYFPVGFNFSDIFYSRRALCLLALLHGTIEVLLDSAALALTQSHHDLHSELGSKQKRRKDRVDSEERKFPRVDLIFLWKRQFPRGKKTRSQLESQI